MPLQLTNTILMIRPANFGFNSETAVNNAFQKNNDSMTSDEISRKALIEFDQMVQDIREAKIQVIVVEDTVSPIKPDAIFPNNWISFHSDGTVITYPMFSMARRNERRDDVIELLEKDYRVDRRYSLEMFEEQHQYLEGTGSMVIDYENKIVYACLSPRTEARVLHKFALLMNFEAHIFRAIDQNGLDIYHTNVMMTMGLDFVVCCVESIEKGRRDEIVDLFERTNKTLIEISLEQMNRFAGNMLQLIDSEGSPVLVMSDTAHMSLTENQVQTLLLKTKLLTVSIPTIESIGGGSARCMIAEVFLPKKRLDPRMNIGKVGLSN
ncbi:MAG: arginine deiminase-related protein [Bacteroidota bacterium]|nr:arginine deiminase-related protein [Bacteroidota bacterium]